MARAQSTAWVHARLAQAGASVELSHDGYSMAPCLRPGDVLHVVSLAGRARPAPGAVLLAMRGERLVAHRLARWAGELAVLRGDANPGEDGALASQLVIGEVVLATRAGRAVRLSRSRTRAALAVARALLPSWVQA